MAEATDRPQVPPDAVMSEEALSASAPASTETYQPLSLLAMASFGLAVVYILVALIGGAIALLSHTPWLMPYWTFLIPLAIVVLCWVARNRIVNSEGTLSGLAFATWGSRLAIIFCIPYAAYYLATFLAVRGPAIDCANDFLQKIKEGRLDLAFAQAQDTSTKGKDQKVLRDELETRFNQPSGTMMVQPGVFSSFCQQHFVRFLSMDGEKAKTTPAGVDSWEFGKGGYRVLLTYHVATTLVEFDLRLDTFGRDPKPGAAKGRQWQVFLQHSESGIVPGSMKYTQQGIDFVKKMMNAQKFATQWAGKATEAEALKPEERESYTKLIRGYETFWSSQQLREDISKNLRKTFEPNAGGKRCSITFQPNGIPFMSESDGRTTGRIDVMLRYTDEGSVMPLYIAEAQIVVSADSQTAAGSADVWRVDALEIESARTAPERRRMQKSIAIPTPEEAGLGKGRAPAKAPPPPELPGISPQRP
jgi:hypothetical protein